MSLLALPLAAMVVGGGIKLLLELLFLCAVAALLWWGFSKIAIPEPVKTIILVAVGLILLYMLWSVAFGGGLGT